jgi:hypothetical protein
MPPFFNAQLDRSHDQLDRALDLPDRRRGQVLDLDAFRRQLDRPSGHTARHTNTSTTDAETALRHELNIAFADLGGATFALAYHGALNDKRLAAHLRRIHELYAELDSLGPAGVSISLGNT